MPELSSPIFSEADDANATPPPNGFPEGMAFSGVNDSARAVMGAMKRFWGRIQGAYASTGSANAYVVTPAQSLAAYVTGERYSFRANFTNTGGATLKLSALGAKTIKKMTAAGKADLASGDIQPGQPVTVEYDGTDMVMVTPSGNALDAVGSGLVKSGSTASLDINSLTEDTSPDISADFVATYDASAAGNKKVKLRNLRSFRGAIVKLTADESIANSTLTAIPWDTAVYDTASIWSNSNPTRLTVPAGASRVRLTANIQWAANATGIRQIITVKNGSNVDGQINIVVPAAAGGAVTGVNGSSAILAVSSGDYFELQANQSSGGALAVAAGTATIFGMEVIE